MKHTTRKSETASATIVGRNPVREALADTEIQLERVFIQHKLSGRWVELMRRDAARRAVPVQFVPKARLDRLAGGGRHQGVAARRAPVSYLELEGMLNAIAANTDVVRSEKPRLLMLDQVEDPRNYGAILRSAVAAGVAGCIVPDRHMAPLSAVAIKSSAGAALRMPIARTKNLATAIDQLKERGYWVVGTAAEGEHSLWDMDWDRPVVMVMGSEGGGLRQAVQEKCDYLISIPMYGPVESLNVSVAAGLVMFAAAHTQAHT